MGRHGGERWGRVLTADFGGHVVGSAMQPASSLSGSNAPFLKGWIHTRFVTRLSIRWKMMVEKNLLRSSIYFNMISQDRQGCGISR